MSRNLEGEAADPEGISWRLGFFGWEMVEPSHLYIRILTRGFE